MTGEKHKILKDILMVVAIIVSILVFSFVVNACTYSFNNVTSFTLANKYITKEKNEKQQMLEIIDETNGRVTLFENEIAYNINYFTYTFDKDAGSVECSFLNERYEDRSYYLIKDGIYDNLERIYYYSV